MVFFLERVTVAFHCVAR